LVERASGQVIRWSSYPAAPVRNVSGMRTRLSRLNRWFFDCAAQETHCSAHDDNFEIEL
jgi:hypothetical protein